VICEFSGVAESLTGTSDEAFQECLGGIPDLIQEAHTSALTKRREELMKLLPEGLTPDALLLASSWFRCKDCGKFFHFAGLVKHTCYPFRLWSYRTSEEIRALKPLEQVRELCERRTWTAEQVIYWKEAAELTEQIIEAAGMDPSKVTPEELDDAKHRFVVFGGPGLSTMTIVSWRYLVKSRNDRVKRPLEWRIMKPEEMSEFKYPCIRLDKEDWGCLHCWKNNAKLYSDVSWSSLKSHLNEKHDIENPTEDDYYCTRPDCQGDYFVREAPEM